MSVCIFEWLDASTFDEMHLFDLAIFFLFSHSQELSSYFGRSTETSHNMDLKGSKSQMLNA